MSQHYFDATYQGSPITVTFGWDRPLGHYYMIIEKHVSSEKDEQNDGYLYSNLNDADAFTKTLDFYRDKLSQLQIQIPDSLFNEVQCDAAMNVGNRYVWHAIDGSFKEFKE